MTTAAAVFPLIGFQPVSNFFVPDSTQRQPLGTKLIVNDPYFGGQELIYVSFPASTALVVGTPVVVDAAYSATAVPNTANLGQPVALVLNAVPSVAAVQYGWAVTSGRFVALSGASVAANAAIGITAAGKLGAVANGKQILNAKVEVAATNTVAKTNVLVTNGSLTLKVSNTDGWFVGLPVSGTGIPAATTVAAIDPDNRTVTMSAVATASGSVTVTGTYNDASALYWNTLYVNAPFAQGQVT